MDIKIQGVGASGPAAADQEGPKAGRNRTSAAPRTEHLELSPQAQALANNTDPITPDKVAQLRAQVQSGTYQPSAQKSAEAMLRYATGQRGSR